MPSQTLPSILDFKTTLLSTMGYTAMLTLVVMMFWLYNRNERALLTLGAAGIVTTIGTLLSYIPLPISPWHNLILDMCLLLLFHPLALVATRQMLGMRNHWWFHVAVVSVTMLCFVYWGGPGSYTRRVISLSSANLLYWMMIIALLCRCRQWRTMIGYRLALGLAVLTATVAISRLTMALGEAGESFTGQNQLFALFTSLSLFWLTFCYSLGLLFISYERLLLQVRSQAQEDGLTHLFNHRTFHELATGLFLRARDRGEGLALLLVDLDHFKNINDRYGHQAGDEVLRQLADCLRAESRHGDLLGRHGGEEFVVMLPQTSRVEAYNATDRLRQAIAALHPRSGELQLAISASIGVACLRDGEHENLASLFLEADLLLYQAKRKGRNRVEIEREPEPALQA
ncbi:GGDEF domain-containing protein [Chromobacterium sp. CV08]|uniref:GGDEF domain-containing protein n=1 Tax=Chromobacterium sp. CV08 TaxID=3133274 RepID=UPI003DA9429B